MTTLPSRRIGIFDSGIGGLTVLTELNQQLSHESILYFADTARLPYGTRSKTEIIQFVREIVQWMVKQDVKMIIMACNTSSALALDVVREEVDVPMLGLILPGARAAIATGSRVGVIATPATAKSRAYSNAITEINPQAKVWEVGCPEFVPLIESNRIHDPYTRQVAQEYLAPLVAQNIDTLIYGCTHYPHLAPVLKTLLPSTVTLVNPAQYVVAAAEQELELMGCKNSQTAEATRFCVSGSPEQFAVASQSWLGFSPTVEQIHLQNVSAPQKAPLESVE